MIASLPADVSAAFAEAPTMIDEPSAETPVDDTPEPAPEPAAAQPDTTTLDIPEEPAKEGVEPEEPVSAAPPEPQAEAGTPSEDLEDGVIKVKDRDGKFKYRLEESRYKTFHGHHRLVQEATELIGEPLTAEAIKLRNDAYNAQERLFTNLTGGDPAEQGEVVNFMLEEMKAAHEVGETGVDPTVPFADTVYTTLKEKAPDAYAHLRFQAGRDFIADMFEHAAQTENQNLFSAAQHFAATLANVGAKPATMTDAQYIEHVREVTGRAGVPFYTPQEMQGLTRGEDPLSAAQRRIQELESQVNGRQQTGNTEQYRTWNERHVGEVNSSVYEDAVKPALASVADKWKDFPDDYKRLVLDPLNSEVAKAVRSDQDLAKNLDVWNARARRATSEGVRKQIGEQIKSLVVNRARIAAGKAAPPILKFAANALTGRSAQTHDRRAAAQTRTAPQGQGTPVKHSVVPDMPAFKNGNYDSATAMKQALALLR